MKIGQNDEWGKQYAAIFKIYWKKHDKVIASGSDKQTIVLPGDFQPKKMAVKEAYASSQFRNLINSSCLN